MRIARVDFPEQVLSALRDDRLVVFAGAGVSMGEPANLPKFRGLAEIVARGTGQSPSGREPVDQFLGRLARSSVDVHGRTADALCAHDLRATELHRQLLRCFRNVEAVRVVTTNFDLLFEQAADEECSRPVEVFRAPALPLGTEFEGIVHLHGSVKRPDQMTLTNADFGRAYLTGRWSPRFLVDLFRTYTVLFVGYSHDDIVMSYLASALEDSGPTRRNAPRRFALTNEPTHERWADLGILPIAYENPDGKHARLVDGIKGLADHMQRDLLSWQRTIGDIAKGLPPVDYEQTDIVDDAFRDPKRVGFFSNSATNVAWVNWLEGRGHLEAVLDPGQTGHGNGTNGRLAWWLCHRFAREHSDELLLLFDRHGTLMSRELWTALASELRSQNDETQEELVWEPYVVAKWLSHLLDTIPKSVLNLEFHFHNLAEAAGRAGLDDSLIAVFDAMAGLSVGAPNASVDHAWALNEVWEECLAPRIALVAEQLLGVMLPRLRERHQWARVWQNATRESDSASWHRDAIEARDDDSRYYSSIDVLIDAARDCLRYLVKNEPLVATSYLDQMVRSDAPLLRRVAVHCAACRDDISADQKIEWLLGHISLHDRACQRELFRFMEATYGDASDAQRRRILTAVEDYPNSKRKSERHDE